jgi:hypothetical protein
VHKKFQIGWLILYNGNNRQLYFPRVEACSILVQYRILCTGKEVRSVPSRISEFLFVIIIIQRKILKELALKCLYLSIAENSFSRL